MHLHIRSCHGIFQTLSGKFLLLREGFVVGKTGKISVGGNTDANC